MTRRLGKYELVSVIGLGGMAEAWKAKILGAAGFERTVVVKRILPHLATNAEFVRLFIGEAQLSSHLHHPNIVQVFELGQVDGQYFMALEFVDGFDLGRLMGALARQQRSPSIPFAVGVLREVCRALAHAHECKDAQGAPLRIVHRDVSPSNVLLGKEGSVKLLDFGVAKALGVASDHRTRTGNVTGKVSYMSPEQADGRPIDHRSDLFAVGIMLYELITGRRLFKAESELETLALVRAAEVEPPSRVNAEVSPALEAVCLKALERDRNDRFQSANALADALAPFAAGWSATSLSELIGEIFTERELNVEATQSRIPSGSVFDDDAGTISQAPTRAEIARGSRRRVAPLLGAALGGALLTAGALWSGVLRPQPAPQSPVQLAPVVTPAAPSVPSEAPPPSVPEPAPVPVDPTASTTKASKSRGKPARSRAHERPFNPNSALP